jgi:hypothetical protein
MHNQGEPAGQQAVVPCLRAGGATVHLVVRVLLAVQDFEKSVSLIRSDPRPCRYVKRRIPGRLIIVINLAAVGSSARGTERSWDEFIYIHRTGEGVHDDTDTEAG